MKTNKRSLCCDRCLEKIAMVNTSLATYWVNVCEIPIDIQLISEDYPWLNKLEEMGFITTTEANDRLVHVRILGRTMQENGDSFVVCGGKCHG